MLYEIMTYFLIQRLLHNLFCTPLNYIVVIFFLWLFSYLFKRMRRFWPRNHWFDFDLLFYMYVICVYNTKLLFSCSNSVYTFSVNNHIYRQSLVVNCYFTKRYVTCFHVYQNRRYKVYIIQSLEIYVSHGHLPFFLKKDHAYNTGYIVSILPGMFVLNNFIVCIGMIFFGIWFFLGRGGGFLGLLNMFTILFMNVVHVCDY